jgi:hypothetical protein
MLFRLLRGRRAAVCRSPLFFLTEHDPFPKMSD